jgi:hypothetical protein
MNESIKKRLRLSKLLALFAILLLLFSYTAKPLFMYQDPGAEDEDDEEENLSFQPFEFLIPDDTEYFEPPLAYLKPLMGEKIYEFYPEGFYAYLIGFKTMPIWRVSLEAPQYPKASFPNGIPVFFHLTDFSGKVNEMNVINHYIGMDPMEVGAVFLRQLIPFIYAFLLVSLILLMVYNGPGWWLFGLIPAAMPVYFLVFYSKWLYWFGHNLHDFGQFSIKPFMPTVFGDGKVAQFTTHSYPTTGFFVLLAILIVTLFAVLIKRKALKDLSKEPLQ